MKKFKENCILLFFLGIIIIPSSSFALDLTGALKKSESEFQRQRDELARQRQREKEEARRRATERQAQVPAPSQLPSIAEPTQTMKGKPIPDPRGGTCSVDGDRRVYCNGKEIGQASRAPLGGVWDLCVTSEYGDSQLMDNYDEAIQSILRRCRR